MEESLAKIKLLASLSDESGRQRIMASLHSLAYSIESPEDTRDRYSFLHLQTAVVKVGFDLGLFKHLTRSTGVLTVDELARKTDAQTELLVRILRYLASIGAIDEVGRQQYLANRTTNNLAEKATEAGVCHWFGAVAPQYQQLPAWLRKTDYISPVDETHTAFHLAWNTSLAPFAWYEGQPELLNYFNEYMATRVRPQHSWLQVYPVLEEASGCSPQRPVYVNIGGGIGHQCAQFKEKYPDLPGRVINQDLSHSITNALTTPGVENMAHNFFEAQPIQGAKVYYLRGVLHDHPRHKVSQIIQNIKAVMAPDSLLLVDDMILPEMGVNAFTASADMSMLTAFASMERTEAQWQETFEQEGLQLVKTHVYNPVTYEAVLDVRLRTADTASQHGVSTT